MSRLDCLKKKCARSSKKKLRKSHDSHAVVGFHVHFKLHYITATHSFITYVYLLYVCLIFSSPQIEIK